MIRRNIAVCFPDMEKFLGCKVFLTGYVKVKEGWRDSANLLHEYGYDEDER